MDLTCRQRIFRVALGGVHSQRVLHATGIAQEHRGTVTLRVGGGQVGVVVQAHLGAQGGNLGVVAHIAVAVVQSQVAARPSHCCGVLQTEPRLMVRQRRDAVGKGDGVGIGVHVDRFDRLHRRGRTDLIAQSDDGLDHRVHMTAGRPGLEAHFMHHPGGIGATKHRLEIDGPAGGSKKTVLAFKNLAGTRKADACEIGGEQTRLGAAAGGQLLGVGGLAAALPQPCAHHAGLAQSVQAALAVEAQHVGTGRRRAEHAARGRAVPMTVMCRPCGRADADGHFIALDQRIEQVSAAAALALGCSQCRSDHRVARVNDGTPVQVIDLKEVAQTAIDQGRHARFASASAPGGARPLRTLQGQTRQRATGRSRAAQLGASNPVEQVQRRASTISGRDRTLKQVQQAVCERCTRRHARCPAQYRTASPAPGPGTPSRSTRFTAGASP